MLSGISAAALRAHIFGFSDTGVLGLDASVSTGQIAGTARESKGLPSTPRNNPPEPAALQADAETFEQDGSPSPIANEDVDLGSLARQGGQTVLNAMPAAAPVAGEVPHANLASEEAEPEAAWVPGTRSAMPERHDTAQFSVIVSGADDALAIAVRAPEEMLTGQVQQLVERTVAEFDMKVADFRINGAPDQSTSTPRSSTRGSNAR